MSDWKTGLLECCGGDGFGKAGESAGVSACKEVGWHQDNFIQTVCGCCGYTFILYYLKHVSQDTPAPVCGKLLVPALEGCGLTQYDCAFGQNLCLVCVCGFIACPYFRCKLRTKHAIKGNIVFDILACYCCGCLAQFQEFREAAIRDPQELPKTVQMTSN